MQDDKAAMTAREAAFRALSGFRQSKSLNGTFDLLNTDNGGIQARDMALATRICIGVVSNMTLCDYYISFFSAVGIKNIEPRALDILRLTVYQLIFMNRIPQSAAVNEGVALAKKYISARASGFINAVARKIANAAGTGSLPDITGSAAERLSIEYSHPKWFVNEILGALGDEGAKALLAANNDPDVPLTAQVNTLRTDTGAVLSRLISQGVEASIHERFGGCITIRGAGRPDRLGPFIDGHIYIQDAAARLAVAAAAPEPGDFVIDGCAAPGGKSFAAAIAMRNTGRICAFDVSEEKLLNISSGAKRLGIGIIETFVRNAADSTIYKKADIVFADVPCSGFGTIRKKPEIRYKTQRDISGLPEKQKEILKGLSAYVVDGGVLLYSTCSVLRRENENVIEWFLSENTGFSAEGFSLPGIGAVPSGMITLWPHIHGTDGFFICRMRKMKENS